MLEMEEEGEGVHGGEVGDVRNQYSEGANEVQACISGEIQRRRASAHPGLVGCDGELPICW